MSERGMSDVWLFLLTPLGALKGLCSGAEASEDEPRAEAARRRVPQGLVVLGEVDELVGKATAQGERLRV